MKVIVTKQNKDGTFNEVGMNNRTIISHLKTKAGVFRNIKRTCSPGTFKFEFFTDSGIYGDPYETVIKTFH